MMKPFTVHVRQSYHQRFAVTVRAQDLQHARRKALKRAPHVPFDWNSVEQESPEVFGIDEEGGACIDLESRRARFVRRDRERLALARVACTSVLRAAMRGDELQAENALDLCAQVIGKRAYVELRRECGLQPCDECGELCICGEDDE